MHLIGNLFNIILYQPLFNALVFLYEYLPGRDFGIAIIVLTILIRILLYPLNTQAIKSQKTLQDIQPKIKEIQEKYKNDRQSQAKATMELYKTAKINPFSGFLPLLIQLPILIALYQVFWKGLKPEGLSHLYSFLPHLGQIDPTFLGIINLAMPSIFLAVLAGIFQFFQTKMTILQSKPTKTAKSAGPDFGQMMQKQMLYFFPIFTIFILWKLPSAIALYWIVTSIFSIIQQYFIFKKVYVQQK